jgi:hypothetical protein
MRCMVETQYAAAGCGSTLYFLSPCIAWWRRSTPQQAEARLRLYYFILPTLYFLSPCVAWWRRSTPQQAEARLRLYYFILPITMRCMVETQSSRSRLRLDCVSTTLYFLSPCIAWWRRSTPQQAAARLRLYYFILPITMHCMVETQYAAAGCGSTASLLYTSYHHALHGGDAVRRSRLRLDCVSTTLYFLLYTSYHHALHGGDAVRRSRLRLDCVSTTLYFLLYTSYHHALHGGDAVRRSRLRLDCVSTTLYFLSPCIAWWRRSTPQQAAARLRLYYFILPTLYFLLSTSFCATIIHSIFLIKG